MKSLHRSVATALLVILIVFAATSCTVREELFLDADGGGTAILSISLSPVLVDYYSDLISAMTGVPADYPVFDLELMAQTFAERPAVRLETIERSSRGNVRLEVSFDSLNDVAASASENAGESAEGAGSFDATDMFTFSVEGVRRRMTVRLDRSTVNGFLSFAPPESAMMSEFLLPPGDGSVSRDDYQAELAWALEEYDTPSEVERVLSTAAIEVVVHPDGRIVSQTGGAVRGETVVFTVPVLELLTLSEERVYELVFEP